MTRSSPAPSRAMNAVGAVWGGALPAARSSPPPFKRYFTPRKSPEPSSPTVAANSTGRLVASRAVTIASATATRAARPRALSEIPGPSSRWPRRSTCTSTSGPNTVSRWAATTTGPRVSSGSPFLPLPPFSPFAPPPPPWHPPCTFPAPSPVEPSVHVPRAVDRYFAQTDLAEQLCHARLALPLGAGRGGNRRQRRLADEGQFVRAFDVMARRADALVREQAGEGAVHGLHTNPLDAEGREGELLGMEERELIYDWNRAGAAFDWTRARVDLNDETLRDGLQSPSVHDPSLDVKKRLLHLMAELGIVAADIGLPGAGPRAVAQVRALAKEIRDQKLPIAPNCAARTVIADIEPIVRISDEVGIIIEAATFIGSSPIRQYAEDWTLDHILRSSEEAVTYAVRHGLPVMYVTEDTTRARPETIKALYGAAIECGAKRICLADTVGHATPDGVRALVNFVKKEIVKKNDVKIDWHGHRDRGMGLINCLAAIEAGVDRVHATALGVGERVGNAEMDLLIVNLKLLGAHQGDIRKLPEYCRLVADAVGVPIPVNYPVVGTDAFRTGTGVHAAAIIKAKKKGHNWLADRVYSSVPAEEFGFEQRIEISPVSGLSNVKYWLEHHGYDPDDDEACRTLFDAAKRTDRVLSDAECHRLLNA